MASEKEPLLPFDRRRSRIVWLVPGSLAVIVCVVLFGFHGERRQEMLQLQGVGRKSQLSDIFSAPLELAKKRMDEALGSGHKNPCLASADSSECSKHWAADYMAKADESISGEITAAPAPAGDVSVSAMVSALKAKLAKMKQEFRLIRGNFEHGPPREMRVKISPRGPRGFTGAPGDIGPQGEQGPQGSRGLVGHKGAVGPPGDEGDRGRTGAKGMTGSIGEAGKEGEKGPPGDQGSPGLQGPPGARGIPGSAGAPGTNGADGLPGPQGENSAEGPPGPRGPTGEPGPPGKDGARGSPGPPGQPGQNGPTGAPGGEGPVGPPGLDGAGPARVTMPVARETDFGNCYVRSAACKAFGVRENLCGLCAGADWRQCATEGQQCKCTGRVRYGNGDSWTDDVGSTSNVLCSVTTFGKDPAPGKSKVCQCANGFEISNPDGLYLNDISFDENKIAAGSYQVKNACLLAMFGNEWVNKETKCADQGSKCTCDGNVRIGLDGKWSAARLVSGSITCQASNFGKDPAPAASKVCMCSSADFPLVPDSKSYAELTSGLNMAEHFYGNCNANDDSQKDCCLNSRVFPAGKNWATLTHGSKCMGNRDKGKPWSKLVCYGMTFEESKASSPPPPPPPPPDNNAFPPALAQLFTNNNPQQALLNSRCAKYRDEKTSMVAGDQMSEMAACMAADCSQSLEGPANGCRFRDSNNFCFAYDSAQNWCAQNPTNKYCNDGGSDWAMKPIGYADSAASTNWQPLQDIQVVNPRASDPKSFTCGCLKQCTCNKKNCFCKDENPVKVGSLPLLSAKVKNIFGDKSNKETQCACYCDAL